MTGLRDTGKSALPTPRELAQTVREQLKHPILHRFEHTGSYLDMAEGEQSPLYQHVHSTCPGCAAEAALDSLLALAEGRGS